MAARLQAAGVRPISARSWTSPTTCSSSSATRCTRSISGEARRAGDPHPARDAGRDRSRTLDGVERKARRRHARDRRPRPRAGDRRRHGRRRVRSLRRDARRSSFESAYFKPASVRRTSKRLGLKTEASVAVRARRRHQRAGGRARSGSSALMEQIGAGQVVGAIVDVLSRAARARAASSAARAAGALLGASVPDADVERILRGLGLDVTPASDGWDVVAPTFRVDLLREVDLIEEVGRHYGFDKLEPTFPVAHAAGAAARSAHRARPAGAPDSRGRRAVGGGHVRVHRGRGRRGVRDRRQAVACIANPLSAKFDTLRPRLCCPVWSMPSRTTAVTAGGTSRLFEIGARFAVEGETRGSASRGPATEHSSTGRAAQRGGLLRRERPRRGVARRARRPGARSCRPTIRSSCSARPRRSSSPAIWTRGARLACHRPDRARDRRGPRRCRVKDRGSSPAELSLDALAQAARGDAADATRPLPRHPVRRARSVGRRRMTPCLPRSFVAPFTRPDATRRRRWRSVSFFDRYQGQGVPQRRRASVCPVRLTFQAADRTLIDSEVQQSVDTILAALIREHGAIQR